MTIIRISIASTKVDPQKLINHEWAKDLSKSCPISFGLTILLKYQCDKNALNWINIFFFHRRGKNCCYLDTADICQRDITKWIKVRLSVAHIFFQFNFCEFRFYGFLNFLSNGLKNFRCNRNLFIRCFFSRYKGDKSVIQETIEPGCVCDNDKLTDSMRQIRPTGKSQLGRCKRWINLKKNRIFAFTEHKCRMFAIANNMGFVSRRLQFTKKRMTKTTNDYFYGRKIEH